MKGMFTRGMLSTVFWNQFIYVLHTWLCFYKTRCFWCNIEKLGLVPFVLRALRISPVMDMFNSWRGLCASVWKFKWNLLPGHNLWKLWIVFCILLIRYQGLTFIDACMCYAFLLNTAIFEVGKWFKRISPSYL